MVGKEKEGTEKGGGEGLWRDLRGVWPRVEGEGELGDTGIENDEGRGLGHRRVQSLLKAVKRRDV
jgi:hypothetical protein